jgi:putative sigma-54 modulation protein
MNIVIQSRSFAVTAAMRQHVERRILFALGWADYKVKKVQVRLSDLNGPRGGEDKRCQIQVLAAGIPEVVIQDVEADVYVAIDRAADRAGRALARRLEKLREHRQNRPHEETLSESVTDVADTGFAGSSLAAEHLH